jgi:mRNA interferase MazF
MIPEGKVRRGRIYLVDLGPQNDLQQQGERRERPVLVVQNDLGNASADTTIVVALSSKLPSKPYPFHVILPAEILGRPGIIRCEQIWTVSLDRIDRRVLGECPPELMEQVEQALRHSLGLSVESGPRYLT